jgi:ParB/RepB/Spo0J family partition protein
LPVEQVIKNENNPREESAFKPEELEALRRSIRIHGILEPLIVTPYDADMFKLIEGERRWTAAKLEGTKEIPAIVVNRMTPHDEVVVMFNVHTQRMPWAVGVQLEAIKRLIESNGHMKDDELAQELGVSVATFRDRRQVLDMGEAVVASIVRGEIEYYAALRADQVARTLTTRRPELTEKLGGSKVVRDKLLSKAKGRKGMTRELEAIRKDAAEPDVAPDDVLETYIQKKDVTLTEARRKAGSLEERRAVEDITRDVLKVERELRRFEVDLEAAPNLDELRRGLVKLIETAQNLEVKILEATMGATN